MCGIAGYFLKENGKNSSREINILLNSIRSRGPDDEGICLISRQNRSCRFYKTDKTVPPISSDLSHIDDKEAIINHEIALIHTRYSIIDLTEGGHQPFISRDKSVIAIFNGEIYNYVELKDELSSLGVKFRTSSDTEVLVEGYRFWGERLWSKLNGFWAVVLYDFKNNLIILSRDRIGVAPLYYREMEEGFFFASYIKSLINICPEGIALNDDVILGFAQTGMKDYDDTTYYSQIKSIPASSTVTFKPRQHTLSEAARKQYWDFPKSRLKPNDISFNNAVKKYRETFFRAVELRLRADVKVAFELSGGLDSSSVVAAAALLRNNDITTYTAKVKGADDEPYARSILKYYPVDYRVLSDIEDNFAADYGSFSKIMEEPYDNPNDYTHNKMLQNMKREGVYVVVTGAGGDEVLAGYEASFWPKAYSELKKGGLLSFILADLYEFLRRFKTFKSSRKTLQHYLVDSLKISYKKFSSPKQNIKRPALSRASLYRQQYNQLSFHEQTLYHFKVALVPYYMRSSDHFTMSIPLEHRFPFLDYRMVEFGLQMPIPYLFKGGWTKYILRKAMEPYLPKKIIWRRKKSGFYFPYHQYLSANQATFEPLLVHLNEINFPVNKFESYEQLLKADPVLLWRLLSTAIWIKYNVKGR